MITRVTRDFQKFYFSEVKIFLSNTLLCRRAQDSGDDMYFLSLVVGLVLYPLCQGDQPEVTVQQGTVRGLYSQSIGGRVYSSFFGIPYAKPPVGKHRFKVCTEINFSSSVPTQEYMLYILIMTQKKYLKP